MKTEARARTNTDTPATGCSEARPLPAASSLVSLLHAPRSGSLLSFMFAKLRNCASIGTIFVRSARSASVTGLPSGRPKMMAGATLASVDPPSSAPASASAFLVWGVASSSEFSASGAYLLLRKVLGMSDVLSSTLPDCL
jgi:hypothetical protein